MATSQLTSANLGERIRKARKGRGLSQQDLARELKVSRKFVGDLEGGKESASLGLALRAVNHLDIDLGTRTEDRRKSDIGEKFAATLAARDYPFAIRLLGEYASSSIDAGHAEMEQAPAIDDPGYLTALAGISRWISKRTSTAPPSWALQATPSAEPFFPAEGVRPVGDSMKALIRRDTPAELAELNVWIRERDLTTI
ncbi:helix-turn-helix transcriptional regulator [Arthrobacter sp. N1]|uniref:helix-turn-helix transcriptional regulator n=1 Tax=Arthrobacter sp. N1 TaxID=619291 RepID=UPI003BAF059B